MEWLQIPKIPLIGSELVSFSVVFTYRGSCIIILYDLRLVIPASLSHIFSLKAMFLENQI